jgi:DNA-binding CsgD family transcriptional regulator
MTPAFLRTLPPDAVTRAFKSLSNGEREMLKLVSGVGHASSFTYREVARIFKLSPVMVERIVRRAMRKVQLELKSQATTDDSPPREAPGIKITLAIPEHCDDQLVVEQMIELYAALYGMHTGAEGSGLIINDEQTCFGVTTLEGAPAQ